MRKTTTNDQQHIIDALRSGDFAYVWQKVKYIGYKRLADINDRYTVFCDCADSFDYEQNNNFIQYYLSQISYYVATRNDTFYVSSNKPIINALKNENISPTECEKSKLVKELKKWSN